MRRTRNKLAASAKIVTPILPRLPSLPQPHPPHHRAAGFHKSTIPSTQNQSDKFNNKRFRYNANGNLSRKLSEKDRHGQALSHRARRRAKPPPRQISRRPLLPTEKQADASSQASRKILLRRTRSFFFSEKLSAFCEFLYYRTIPLLWINHQMAAITATKPPYDFSY